MNLIEMMNNCNVIIVSHLFVVDTFSKCVQKFLLAGSCLWTYSLNVL
jgi:hypothetical protein